MRQLRLVDNPLGGSEGCVQEAVHGRLDALLLYRDRVRLLELEINMHVARHHGFHAGGHLENMPDRFFVPMQKGHIFRPGAACMALERLLHGADVFLDSVEVGFRTVAGGQEDQLGTRVERDAAIHGAPLFPGRGEGFPDRYGSLRIIDAQCVKCHSRKQGLQQA